MMIDANTPTGTQAETDLGYPRSYSAKVVMAFCVILTLAGGVCLAVGGLVLLLTEWDGPSSLVSMNSVLLLVGLWTVALAIHVGHSHTATTPAG